MNPSHLMNQPCVITKRTQTGPDDVYGTPTWVTSTVETVCSKQPKSSQTITDEIGDRPAARSGTRAWFRPSEDLSHVDFITVNGEHWEVDGEPRVWYNPRTNTATYIEVDLVGFSGLAEEGA